MKTAIYIEDGVVQLVLTPESDFEIQTIASLADKKTDTKIFRGTFYDCRGGWTRQTPFYSQHGSGDWTTQSLIIRTSEAPKTPLQP